MFKEKHGLTVFKVNDIHIGYKYSKQNILYHGTEKIQCVKNKHNIKYSCDNSFLKEISQDTFIIDSANDIITMYFLDKIIDLSMRQFKNQQKYICNKFREIVNLFDATTYKLENKTSYYHLSFGKCIHAKINNNQLFSDYIINRKDNIYQVFKFDKYMCNVNVFNQDKFGRRDNNVTFTKSSEDKDKDICYNLITDILNNRYNNYQQMPSNLTSFVVLFILLIPTYKLIKFIKIRIIKHVNFKNVVDGKLCGVCYDDLKDPHVILPCAHVFCGFCINRLTRCPMCNGYINKRQSFIYS
jgi:hypothetical protein